MLWRRIRHWGGGTKGADSGSNVEASGINSYEALVEAISGAKDGDTITLAGDISATSTINIDKTITLTGGSISAADEFTGGSLISLETEGKTLTLGNVTLNANEQARVVYCNAGKIIVNGATITGGKAPDGSYIGGVYMTNASQFEMNSGSITGNEVSDAFKDKYVKYSADLWIGANAKGDMTDINSGTVGSIFVNANEFSATNPGSFKMNNGTVENIYVEYGNGYGATFTYNGGKLNNLYVSTTNGNGDNVEIDNPLPGMTYTGGKTSDDEIAPVASVGNVEYGSLQAAVNAAESGATVNLKKNVTERIIINDGKNITINLNKYKISYTNIPVYVKHGNLTITGSGTIEETSPDFGAILVKGSDNVSDKNYSVVNVDGNIKLTGWAPVFIDQNNNKAYGVNVKLNDVALNSVKDTSNNAGSGIYLNGLITDTENAPVINVTSTNITSEGNGIYLAGYNTTTIEKSSIEGDDTGIEIRAGKLSVKDSVINGKAERTVVNADGNGSTTVGAGIAIAQHTTKLPIDVKISSGKITGASAVYESNPQKNGEDSIAKIKLSIVDGNFTGDIYSEDIKGFISGGLFSKEFDKSYCETGLKIIKNTDKSTNQNYPVTVGTIKANNVGKIREASELRENVTTVGANILGEENIKAAKAIADSVTLPSEEGIKDNTAITKDDKDKAVTALVEAGKLSLPNNEIPENTTVTVVKETYLEVELTDLKMNNDNPTVTMNITPKYNLIAKVEPDKDKEPVIIKSAQDTTVTAPTKISVKLPKVKFTEGKKVYINHDNGKNIYVTNVKDGDGTVEFTTNGFSPFVFALSDSSVVAEVNGNAYTSLQAAVDAAEDNAEITIVGGNKDYTATITGSSKTVKITNGFDGLNNINVTVNGTPKTIKPNCSEIFTYTRHSSGSSTTTYTVTVGSVSNGTVTSSHKSAASGATVTLTVKPADGYAVEAVTAKDAKGNAVKVTEKDGKYTFAMPASNVTVSASFVKKGEQPAAKLFDDVAQGAYYYDAVKWAVDKGVTNGKTSNLFGSDDPCTRAQIVTFLWRAAGSPAASASVGFTDVKDSDYYAKAVAWAVEKGITNGTGDGKFSSDDTCTRAQCAAFLYRAAGSPEVTDAAAFSDVAADAYYAKAVAWAEKNGITNGLGNGKFGSDNSCTRAQIITFLYRTYQGK